jgi:hypothetical protein
MMLLIRPRALCGGGKIAALAPFRLSIGDTEARKEEPLPQRREFPGGFTLAQWRKLPRLERYDLVRRAQSDLLGSFRCCTNKMCKRARSCSARDPDACRARLWRLVKKKPKTLREEYARLGDMIDDA